MEEPAGGGVRYNGRSYDRRRKKQAKENKVTYSLLSLLEKEWDDPWGSKCGPDYIDGLFHRKVLGAACNKSGQF